MQRRQKVAEFQLGLGVFWEKEHRVLGEGPGSPREEPALSETEEGKRDSLEEDRQG